MSTQDTNQNEISRADELIDLQGQRIDAMEKIRDAQKAIIGYRDAEIARLRHALERVSVTEFAHWSIKEIAVNALKGGEATHEA